MLIRILLAVHVGGAILGLGPTSAFGVLGKLAANNSEWALGLLTAMTEIANKLVKPVGVFTQPVSGVWLIFATGRASNFFQHEWLWIAILIYIPLISSSLSSSVPRLHRMIQMLKTGEGSSPEFQRLSDIERRVGSVYGLMLVTIIVLMVVKPGA